MTDKPENLQATRVATSGMRVIYLRSNRRIALHNDDYMRKFPGNFHRLKRSGSIPCCFVKRPTRIEPFSFQVHESRFTMQQYEYDWDTGERVDHKRSGNPADILARMQLRPVRIIEPEPHALIIAAKDRTRRERAADALRIIVGPHGVAPGDALRELAGRGYGYRLTDSELAIVKRLARVVCSRSGQRSYRWQIRN